MCFQINSSDILEGKLAFVCGDNEYSGVKKVAGYVCDDMEKVFSARPAITNTKVAKSIVVATINVSDILGDVVIDVSDIEGKRECFKMCQSADGCTLYIIGSDKRGTIYGLFHLSELLGVSPFVDWLDVMPAKKEFVNLHDADMITSKEPSVRFRGFFINDEWPAFGNWTLHHFDGINAKCYEQIFKVLLRMKGNYLWPAMWTGRFAVDGPGLLSADLADELGVVMGMSHHEPCLRHGEEYKYLRGKDSIYGDAWDFRSNREGITRFWEDGLKRNGMYENVITVGMRGEFDSTILGENATLQDNIDLLRDVLVCQNQLIKKYVNEDLDKVPRMLALYKEVEPFFYGDENSVGLIGSEELEGVTLMLCDDNHGNLRTLPDDSMRNHKGGYGMYYHFDYHGSPVSYEWVNSSSLHKTWEQMTNAYEFGIRDLWIVNVGDIFSTEFPLSFFMSMAYDYDKWGISNINSAADYTKYFVNTNFPEADETKKTEIVALLEGYTRIAHIRRPEHMSDKVYAPMAYREREELYAKCTDLMNRAKNIYDNDYSWPFYEIVYYPLMANLNVQKLWLDTTYNHFLSDIGSSKTGEIADKIEAALTLDEEIVNELHSAHDSKWYGMGLSEHIGFNNWNEEECRYPVIHRLKPGNKPRIAVVIPENGQTSEGGDWTKKKLVLPDFARYNCDSASIYLVSTGKAEGEYSVVINDDCISASVLEGKVETGEIVEVELSLNRSNIKPGQTVASVMFANKMMHTTVEILLPKSVSDDIPAGTYVFNDDYISIEADGYSNLKSGKNDAGEDAKFMVLDDFGKTKCGLKVFPVTGSYYNTDNRPTVSYSFLVDEPGDYQVDMYIAPTNPVYRDNKLQIAYNCNGNNSGTVDAFYKEYKIDDKCMYWCQGALDNIRVLTVDINCVNGVNTIDISPLSPGMVLEKVVIYKSGRKPQASYLGPKETWKIN